MTPPILVTGGTGTLGRHVVPRLREAGRDVRVLSRKGDESADGVEYVSGDLLKDEGIGPAVAGIETILHLAGGPKGDDEATRNLVRAASRAGARHLVYISVIGSDRVPLGYFKSKLAAERAVADSGIPWTTLRAAQFHDLILKVVQGISKLPVIPVPGGLRFQPVDSNDVAARLVELTLGEPVGRVPDLPGPKVYEMKELLRGYLKARGKRRLMVPVRLPGKVGRAYRAGENLNLDAVAGRRTWEEFLAERSTYRSRGRCQQGVPGGKSRADTARVGLPSRAQPRRRILMRSPFRWEMSKASTSQRHQLGDEGLGRRVERGVPRLHSDHLPARERCVHAPLRGRGDGPVEGCLHVDPGHPAEIFLGDAHRREERGYGIGAKASPRPASSSEQSP